VFVQAIEENFTFRNKMVLREFLLPFSGVYTYKQISPLAFMFPVRIILIF
jgi:hypothetical protein